MNRDRIQQMRMKEEHSPFSPKADECLYKIGMFAAMNRVTVKALRFYKTQGSLPAFLAAFTKKQSLTAKEIEQIQCMIDAYRQGKE